MNWKRINANKNSILAIFFGFISGIKEHSALWGFGIALAAFLIFCLMDKMRAPLGEGPLDRFVGIHKR
jgi:hypothetical protein